MEVLFSCNSVDGKIYRRFHFLYVVLIKDYKPKNCRFNKTVQKFVRVFYVYVIEFKYDKSAEIALDQIYSTGYSEQFISQRDKVIHLLGINFSKEEKNIKDWKEALL